MTDLIPLFDFDEALRVAAAVGFDLANDADAAEYVASAPTDDCPKARFVCGLGNWIADGLDEGAQHEPWAMTWYAEDVLRAAAGCHNYDRNGEDEPLAEERELLL